MQRFRLKYDPFLLGILAWLLVLVAGYFDFRLDLGGRYRDGQTIPTLMPIGIDFNAIYIYAGALRDGMESYLTASAPAGPNVYPPLVTVLMLPLTFLYPETAYEVYAALLLLFLFGSVFLCLDLTASLDRRIQVALALLVTALLFHTYPINFSIERGNSDIAALFFSVLALWCTSRNRMIPAVLALTMAAQFKVYPAVLIFPLVFRFGYKAAAAFAVTNGVSLLVLGVAGLTSFLGKLAAFSADPYVWPGNHSLHSFAAHLVKAGIVAPDAEGGVRSAAMLIALLLFLVSVVLLYRAADVRRLPFLADAREIGVVGIGFSLMSLLPSTSHDYKLAIHFAPFLILLILLYRGLGRTGAGLSVMAVLLGAANGALFLPRYVPFLARFTPPSWYEILQMKTPALMAMLVVFFLLSLTGARFVPAAAEAASGDGGEAEDR